LKKVIKNHSF